MYIIHKTTKDNIQGIHINKTDCKGVILETIKHMILYLENKNFIFTRLAAEDMFIYCCHY